MKRNGNAERRRRENRDAESAEEGGVWGGGIPSPVGKGFGEGAVPRPQNFFCLALVHFGAFCMGACFNVTVNNWSIQRKKQQERRSRCMKRNGNGVPVRSRPTRTLQDPDRSSAA